VPIRQDQEVAVGPLRLRILWPPPAEGPFDPTAEANDRAVVALASAYGASALLTADAESNVLARIPLAPVDVLKVSHHGSRDEGLAGILDVLHPRVALVEVGRRNSYGHPAPSTIAALSAVSQVLRTDREGTTGVDLVAGRAWVVGGSG
jgi:competence protein ComEC